jgi:hypothetical protein
MMTELSPTSRALLDAARDGLSPDAAALRRVRGKVDAAVGGAVAGGSAMIAKLAIVSAFALLVAGAVVLRGEDDDQLAPALTFGASVSAPAVENHRVHEAPPPAATHIEMPAQRASRPVIFVEETPPPPVVAPVPRGIDLAREVELVDAAMASLRTGDAKAALASVRLHRAETNGRGQLAEDAAAIEIESLCKLHDRNVVAKLEAFDARWPESAQRSRLSTNCF